MEQVSFQPEEKSEEMVDDESGKNENDKLECV